MTNHPKRKPAYRIQHTNGRFSHVRGKAEALILARTQAFAPGDTDEDVLRREWGVRIERISAQQAKAVGV